jgi:hypothetical protein
MRRSSDAGGLSLVAVIRLGRLAKQGFDGLPFAAALPLLGFPAGTEDEIRHRARSADEAGQEQQDDERGGDDEHGFQGHRWIVVTMPAGKLAG